MIRRCNIHSVEDGIYFSTGGITAELNYVHDLASKGADPHYDGMQIHGGNTDITIRRNSIMVRKDDNSAITTGAVQRVLIEDNKLYGGAYTVRIDGRSGGIPVQDVALKNNRFGPHVWGYTTFDQCNPTMIGNVDDITGASI